LQQWTFILPLIQKTLMTEEYKATPEQWFAQELCAPDGDSDSACILELRARVEALEADATEQARSQEFCIDFIVQRLEKLEAAKDQLSESPAKPLDEAENDRRFEAAKALIDKPASAPTGWSLVDRVAGQIGMLAGFDNWSPEARAAIREVAAWMELQQEVPVGSSTASADYFAAMLREEAER